MLKLHAFQEVDNYEKWENWIPFFAPSKVYYACGVLIKRNLNSQSFTSETLWGFLSLLPWKLLLIWFACLFVEHSNPIQPSRSLDQIHWSMGISSVLFFIKVNGLFLAYNSSIYCYTNSFPTLEKHSVLLGSNCLFKICLWKFNNTQKKKVLFVFVLILLPFAIISIFGFSYNLYELIS